MKKFIFTAIAMVMFSVNSFGNAIANNDEMTNSKEYEEVVLVYNCYDVAAAVEADARASAAIMSESDYYNIFATAYEICAGSGSCTTCLKGN